MSLKNFLLLCFLVASPACFGEKIELRMNFEVTEEGFANKAENSRDVAVGDTASAIVVYDRMPETAPDPLGFEPSLFLWGDSLTIQVGDDIISLPDPFMGQFSNSINFEVEDTLFFNFEREATVALGNGSLPLTTDDIVLIEDFRFAGFSVRERPITLEIGFSDRDGYRLTDFSVTTIPEPTALVSMLLGGTMLWLTRRKLRAR